MRFYLSSYGLGNETERLVTMLPVNRRTAYVPNALDFSDDSERRDASNLSDMAQLKSVGLDAEILDLRLYFGKQAELEKFLEGFGVIWVRGGNTFVLRQAMRLSGFDAVFKRMQEKDVLYGGYSAGVCVLAPSLRGIDLMDDSTQTPYGDGSEVVWEGLGILDYYVVPHYKSDHPESEMAERSVQYFTENRMPFRTLRDGEVIIIE